MFVAVTFPKKFEFANDDVLRWRNPYSLAAQIDAPPMLKCPMLKCIVRGEIKVCFELSDVMNHVEHTRSGPIHLCANRFYWWNVVGVFRECRHEAQNVNRAQQQNNVDIGGQSGLAINTRCD